MLKKLAVYGAIATTAVGVILSATPAQASTLPIVPSGTPLAQYVGKLLGSSPLGLVSAPGLASRLIPAGVPMKIA